MIGRTWFLLAIHAVLVRFSVIIEAGRFHACESDADCQYQDCLTGVGYVSTAASWMLAGMPSYAQCRVNSSLGLDAYVCQYSISFIDWGMESQNMLPSERREYSGCIPGPCALGWYKDEGVTIDRCRPCAKGEYNADPWARGCTLCEKGKYQGEVSRSSCEDCPAGTYGVGLGKTSRGAACEPCEDGYYSAAGGAVQCLACAATPPTPAGYYQSMSCSAIHAPRSEPCPQCEEEGGARACERTAPTQCGVVNCTRELMGERQPDYTGDWLTAEYKCRLGWYLRGFTSKEDKDCRRCPSGMVGLDGIKCEWCAGPLEEPYWLDQSSCVCKAGAVMNRTGGCECPDGWRFDAARHECVACGNNSYGRGGECYDCGAGNYSAEGATECVSCGAGKYRLHGQAECQGCANASHYAPHPWNNTCVACNRSCTAESGWRDAGPCPSGGTGYRVCAPCEVQRPNHSTWVTGGGCVYKCDAGYYFSEWDGGACKACSTGRCPAGFKGRPCTEYSDRVCDAECVNASKPTFHSTWAQATPDGDACPWACEPGYKAVETDYWMFRLHECIPSDEDGAGST